MKSFENACKVLHSLQHDNNMKVLKIINAFCRKICAFSMQQTKHIEQVSVTTFCKVLFFKKYQLNIYFGSFCKVFHAVKLPCTVFIVTCNQKLSCGYKLFITRIFYYDFRKLSSREIFYHNVKIGLFE